MGCVNIKKFAIALLIVQAIGVIGALINKDYSLFTIDASSSYAVLASVFRLLAFFAFGIVGMIILLVKKHKEKQNIK